MISSLQQLYIYVCSVSLKEKLVGPTQPQVHLRMFSMLHFIWSPCKGITYLSPTIN